MKGQSTGRLEIYQNVTVRHISPDTTCNTHKYAHICSCHTSDPSQARVKLICQMQSSFSNKSQEVVHKCAGGIVWCGMFFFQWMCLHMHIFAYMYRIVFSFQVAWPKARGLPAPAFPLWEQPSAHQRLPFAVQLLKSLNTLFNHTQTHTFGCISTFSFNSSSWRDAATTSSVYIQG